MTPSGGQGGEARRAAIATASRQVRSGDNGFMRRADEKPVTQYEDRVSESVRTHTESALRRWIAEGRDDKEIESLVRSLVLTGYVEGGKDLYDQIGDVVRLVWRSVGSGER